MQVLQRGVLDELVHAGGHPVLEHLHEGDALHHHAFSDVGLREGVRSCKKRERKRACSSAQQQPATPLACPSPEL
jgi:hypothetical protein